MSTSVFGIFLQVLLFMTPLGAACAVFCAVAVNLWNGTKRVYREYAQKPFLTNSGDISGAPPKLKDVLLPAYLEEEKRQRALATGRSYTEPLKFFDRDECFSADSKLAMTEDVFAGRQVVDEFEELRKHVTKNERRLQARISGEVLWDDVIEAHAKHIVTLPARVKERR